MPDVATQAAAALAATTAESSLSVVKTANPTLPMVRPIVWSGAASARTRLPAVSGRTMLVEWLAQDANPASYMATLATTDSVDIGFTTQEPAEAEGSAELDLLTVSIDSFDVDGLPTAAGNVDLTIITDDLGL